MLIQEEQLRYWVDHFYGYGTWQAKVWFVSYEEGGGDHPQEVAEKFNYFFRTHSGSSNGVLCNIRSLYKEVTLPSEEIKGQSLRTLNDYRFGDKAVLHGFWKNLIAFEFGYRREPLPDLFDYQRRRFLNDPVSSEALIQLYPLPSPHNHAWYYSWLNLPHVDFLKTRIAYEQQVYQQRVNTIINKIVKHKPDLILMYGMSNIGQLKQSFQDFFEGVQFKMVKSIKKQMPQYHRAEVNNTTLLITTQIPGLRHNRPETGFDWYAFGQSV